MTNSRLKWNSCERDSCRLEALINRILVHFHSSIRLFTFLDLFIYSIFIYLRFLCLLTFLYLFTFSHRYSYLFIFIFIYLHIPVELTFDLTGATNKYDKIFTNTRSLETLLLNWSRARGEKRGCGSVLIGEESHGICFRVRGKARGKRRPLVTTVSHFSLYFAAKANEEEQRDRAQGVQSTRGAESQDIPSGNFSFPSNFFSTLFSWDESELI